MNGKLFIALTLVLLLVLYACDTAESEMVQVPDTTAQYESHPFTITATSGKDLTRVSFEDNGLDILWQPGDELYLVDAAGKNSTVTLTSTLKEPSKESSFVSSVSVLSGEYIVLSGCSTLNQMAPTLSMTSDKDALGKRVRLYGTLVVADGQTSATISLKHALSKMTFKFANVPDGLTNMQCGLCLTTDGVPYASAGTMSGSGWSNATTKYTQKLKFGWDAGTAPSMLLPPVDFSGKQVVFTFMETVLMAHTTHMSFSKKV